MINGVTSASSVAMASHSTVPGQRRRARQHGRQPERGRLVTGGGVVRRRTTRSTMRSSGATASTSDRAATGSRSTRAAHRRVGRRRVQLVGRSLGSWRGWPWQRIESQLRRDLHPVAQQFGPECGLHCAGSRVGCSRRDRQRRPDAHHQRFLHERGPTAPTITKASRPRHRSPITVTARGRGRTPRPMTSRPPRHRPGDRPERLEGRGSIRRAGGQRGAHGHIHATGVRPVWIDLPPQSGPHR